MQVQRCLWLTCFRICYPSPQWQWLPAIDKGLGREPGFLVGLHVDLVYCASQALALRQWQPLYLSPCLCSSPSFSITCSSSSAPLSLSLPLYDKLPSLVLVQKTIHAVTTGHCSRRHLQDLGDVSHCFVRARSKQAKSWWGCMDLLCKVWCKVEYLVWKYCSVFTA